MLSIIIIFGHVDKEIVNKISKHVTKVPVSGKNKSGSTVLNLKRSHKYCSCFKTRVSQLMLMIISQYGNHTDILFFSESYSLSISPAAHVTMNIPQRVNF